MPADLKGRPENRLFIENLLRKGTKSSIPVQGLVLHSGMSSPTSWYLGRLPPYMARRSSPVPFAFGLRGVPATLSMDCKEACWAWLWLRLAFWLHSHEQILGTY
ncbi:hypothetical protein AVEN_117998-1 [Araneus ventricosus]|uniref:Uncharacterized protein n=1 Tax=Araneus ventricosus TaxID=182803 RepID=A0A4Y2C9V4_ARAVE|nr:hypothetical protein AVEN_117998-1 [Araneus ventricosus]